LESVEEEYDEVPINDEIEKLNFNLIKEEPKKD